MRPLPQDRLPDVFYPEQNPKFAPVLFDFKYLKVLCLPCCLPACRAAAVCLHVCKGYSCMLTGVGVCAPGKLHCRV